MASIYCAEHYAYKGVGEPPVPSCVECNALRQTVRAGWVAVAAVHAPGPVRLRVTA